MWLIEVRDPLALIMPSCVMHNKAETALKDTTTLFRTSDQG